jgi:hypothetical protein
MIKLNQSLSKSNNYLELKPNSQPNLLTPPKSLLKKIKIISKISSNHLIPNPLIIFLSIKMHPPPKIKVKEPQCNSHLIN